MRKMMEEVEEEGDVEEINYVDGKEGKIWRNPYQYAMMIKELLNKRKLVEALNILEVKMLKEERGKPDVYIYNLLISGCAKEGYTKKAFQLFNEMKKRGLKPKQSTYTSLFNACSEGPFAVDSLKKARHLRELMLEKGVEPNMANYHAMIKAFGRHGDLETSFSIVDEMASKQIPLTSVTFNFLLQASASDKEAGFRHALIVWRKMLEKKVAPSVFTFNLLLRCTRDCGSGDVKSAQELVTMLGSGQVLIDGGPSEGNHNRLALQSPNLLLPTVQPNSIVSVTSAIDKASDRLMLLGNTEGLFGMMDFFKVVPDIKTFTQLLEIIPSTTEVEDKLIAEMKQRQVTIDVDFCNMLIRKRNYSERTQLAVEVLDLMKKEKLIPNIMTFGVLALGCNNLESTKTLISNIEEVGFRVNIQILGGLMKRSYEMLDIDMALFVIENLLKEEIKPCPNFMVKLISLRKSLQCNKELKEQGQEYHTNIDTMNFDEKLSTLLKKIKKLKTKVEDLSKVHPWEQFTRKAESFN
nr:pentatricopeptide repeat-containing protein 1, mitochondrial isoform X2 [Halyomorpha halys]